MKGVNAIPRLAIAVPLALAIGAFAALMWAAERVKTDSAPPAPHPAAAPLALLCEAAPLKSGAIGIVVGVRP